LSTLIDKLVPNTLMLVFYILTGLLLFTLFGWWTWRRLVPIATYYRSAGWCLHCEQEKRYYVKVYFLPSLENRSKDAFVQKVKMLRCGCGCGQ